MKKTQKTQDQYTVYERRGQLVLAINCEKRIPENASVRLVSAVLEELNYEKLYRAYSPRGRKSAVDPQILFEVLVYGYLCGIYSSRKLEEACRYRIDFLWLLGEAEAPDHSTIARFRTGRCRAALEDLFYQLVRKLEELEETDHKAVFIDGTKMESRAGRYSFVWRKSVEKHLASVKEQIRRETGLTSSAALQNHLSTIAGDITFVHGKGKRKSEAQRSWEGLQELLERWQRYETQLHIMGEGRNSYAKTDHDATFMRMKEDAMNNGQTKPGYNLQIGTENQFILDFGLFQTPSDPLTMIPFFNSFFDRYSKHPQTGVADAGYGSEENYRFMEEAGIDAYVKYNRFHREQRMHYVPDSFSAQALYYNTDGDYYVCPMGQHMERIGTTRTKTKSGYISKSSRYKARRCEGCPLRGSYFKAKGDRIIEVNHPLAEYRRKARERLTSEEGIEHRGRRCIEPEAVFGQMKYDMGYKRFRHFGLDKVKMDFAFFAIAFNLKKMCSKIAKAAKNGGNTTDSGVFYV